MARQIQIDVRRTIQAPRERVHQVLADYVNGRPQILPPANYLDYKVLQGGMGAGTQVAYRLRAGGRERPYEMEVSEPSPGATLVERDHNSSLVTTWTLAPTPDGRATNLTLSTSWEGGEGVGGFFERTFAPRGLRRIYGELLDRLTQKVTGAPT
ncbi:MAG TPA: SRPBCC family protein [Actinomycetes bacterium]|jgi:uncharacterized protein YndB with AHSA1/START domain|nr:SRPBCC family protein [Actinomycetes bacterium]